MMMDVLFEEANIYLQQYVPEWCVRVAEEQTDMSFFKPSHLQITFL